MPFLLIIFSFIIVFIITLILFHPPTMTFLQSRDDIIRVKPVPEVLRDGFLVRFFYPNTRKSKMAPADQILVWVVIFSVLFVFYELGVVLNYFPDDEQMIVTATIVFVVIFSVEFIIRFSLKGFQFMWPWGLLDIIVIVVDVVFLIIFFWFSDNPEGSEVITLLRVLRVARLLRVLKIVKYLSDVKKRRALWRRYKPHLRALCYLSLIAIAVTLLFGGIISIIQGKSPREGWIAIFQQLQRSLDADVNSDPFSIIAAILILAAIANIVAVFYAPIMRQIQQDQKNQENLDLMEGHVIICLNKHSQYFGFIEELAYVFRNSADKEVFLISGLDAREDIDVHSDVKVLHSEVSNPKTWKDCAATSAETIIILGEHSTLTQEDYLNFIEPGLSRNRPTAILINIDEKITSYKRRITSKQTQIVDIPLENLIDAIEKNAWSSSSLQYSYLHKLTDEYEDELEFPDLDNVNGVNDSALRISELIKNGIKLECSVREHNILVDLSKTCDQEENEELAELRNLELLISTLIDNPCEAKDVCIFAYVSSFDLISRTSEFNNNETIHLSIFAVEFAAALAIFHETIMPGIIHGWLSDWSSVDGISVFSSTEKHEINSNHKHLSPQVLTTRLDIDNKQTVLGIIDAENNISVTTSSKNRFNKNQALHVIVST